MMLEDILEKNRQFKCLHAGRRCFIIGNGPSLKAQDLSLLKDDVKFVVSSFYRHPDAKMLRPDYWVMADPDIWMNPKEHFFPVFEQARGVSVSTKLFLPTGGFTTFADFPTGPLIDLFFFHYDVRGTIDTPLDFASGIPPYGQNVVMICIMLAFYMGCDPIYLIGCDHDFMEYTKEDFENKENMYFYTLDKSSKNNTALTWEEWQGCMFRMRLQYEELRKYANMWGFHVFNATHGGCLEVFRRVEYESLFLKSVDRIGKKENTPRSEPIALGRSAVKLMNQGETGSALELLEVAIRNNVNRERKVEGLEYLMALCLARLGVYGRAVIYARQDMVSNNDNREKAGLLVEQLSRYV